MRSPDLLDIFDILVDLLGIVRRSPRLPLYQIFSPCHRTLQVAFGFNSHGYHYIRHFVHAKGLVRWLLGSHGYHYIRHFVHAKGLVRWLLGSISHGNHYVFFGRFLYFFFIFFRPFFSFFFNYHITAAQHHKDNTWITFAHHRNHFRR